MLARAIQYLHDRKLFHGGLNPGNIHVTSAGIPKVTGLSRGRNRSASGGTSSAFDELSNPKSYLAPEQLHGVRRRLERTVDIFALGAILHVLLTGRVLTLESSSVEESALASRAASRLQAICWKCLAREPGQRFASAGELADELEELIDR
jgi:serine/threonine protein kinase